MTKITINVIVLLVLMFLAAVLFANSMTKPLGRDEHMYCTAGVLMAKGNVIYKDFSYPYQMPYHPLLYSAIFKITNTSYYLLTGRIISTICNILTVVCIIAIYYRVFGRFDVIGSLLASGAVVLYVFNPLVDYSNGYAWNHDVVIFLVMLSFWLFLSLDFNNKSKYGRIALIGALLTFATWMRITTGLVQVLFFVILLFAGRKSKGERVKIAGAFLIATLVVSIWPVCTILGAPKAFLLGLFRIPVLNRQWVLESGLVFNKFALTFVCLMLPGYLALIVLIIFIYLTFVCHRNKFERLNIVKIMFAPLLAAGFFVIAFVPPSMWRQYLAMPVPFIIVSLAYPLFYIRKYLSNRYFTTAFAFVAISAVVVVNSNPIVLQRISRLFEPNKWTPIQVHRISDDISKRCKEPKLVLTLSPLYALEGGCLIYPELSAGPFVYRIGDFLTAEERHITNTMGAEMLEEILSKSAPSAVIVGGEMEILEADLYKTAVKPNWQKSVYDNGITVYLKP